MKYIPVLSKVDKLVHLDDNKDEVIHPLKVNNKCRALSHVDFHPTSTVKEVHIMVSFSFNTKISVQVLTNMTVAEIAIIFTSSVLGWN